MKNLILPLLLLLSPAARAAVSEQAAVLFDGRRGAALPLTLPPAVPSVAGKSPEAPPPDLIAAGAVWGHEAQAAKLFASNPQAKTEFTFAVIGDVEEGRFFWERWFTPGKDAFQNQLRMIHAGKSDFIMQLGDLVSKGTVKNYRACLAFLADKLTLPLLSVIGNHDRSRPNGDADKGLYKAVFGKTDFSYDYNGWRFIGLDTSDRMLTPGQLAWLEQALSSDLPALIFTHVPPGYLRKKIKSELPEPTDKAWNMSGYFDEGSAAFGELVARRKVRRVYMGHIHAFGLAEENGVRYVLTAGGGSPLYPLPPGYPKKKMAHFVLVTAGPQGLREVVHEVNGATFELPR